jgi:hypothetical protein
MNIHYLLKAVGKPISLKEKRAFQRISVRLDGNLFSHDTSCLAYIGNISALGVNVIIAPTHCSSAFVEETKQESQMNIPSGETIKLNCISRWSSSISPQGLMKEIGLEIIAPPPQYKDFLTTLK